MDENIWRFIPSVIMLLLQLLLCLLLVRNFLLYTFLQKILNEDAKEDRKKIVAGEFEPQKWLPRCEKLNKIRFRMLLEFWKWPLSKYLQEIEGRDDD